MPHSEDVNDALATVHVIDNAIWPKDDFSDGLVVFLRNGATRERQAGCEFDVAKDAIRETGGGSRIIPGDESNNLPEILDGCLRPDYRESHSLKLSFTSSWGTTLPARTSARPLSIAARKRTRSSMSSHVAESGSS
jgi:hypothetical protein